MAGPPADPILTLDQCRRLDAIAIDELGMPGVLLMENAAMALERAALALLDGLPGGAETVVVAGPGNNGGDGFALARRLVVAGRAARIVSVKPVDGLTGDARTNAVVADRMGIRIDVADGSPDRLGEPALIVDAILGSGATDAPRGDVPALIGWINAERARGSRVLAVDIPTGLHGDTGDPTSGDAELVVRADRTVTLGAMKRGLLGPERFTGAVEVGSIGIPGWVVERARGG